MPLGTRIQVLLAAVVLVVAVVIVARDPVRREAALADIRNLLDTVRALTPPG